MAKVIIQGSNKRMKYLKKHLRKEHPKLTKKIKLILGKR